jgi:hypothetical protein
MIPLQQHMKLNYGINYFSTFDDRPGKLFDGLEHIRATVFLSKKLENNCRIIFTSKYHRWYTEIRDFLFESIVFHKTSYSFPGAIPKIGSTLQEGIFQSISQINSIYHYLSNENDNLIYYHNAPQYWVRATTFVPYFWNERDGQKPSQQIKALSFSDRDTAVLVNAVLNSSLFYIWFLSLSDCRHLNMREVGSFPIGLRHIDKSISQELVKLNDRLMESFMENKLSPYNCVK